MNGAGNVIEKFGIVALYFGGSGGIGRVDRWTGL